MQRLIPGTRGQRWMALKDDGGQLKGGAEVPVGLAMQLVAEGSVVTAEVGAITAEGIHHGSQPAGSGAAATGEALGKGLQIQPAAPELHLGEGVEQQAVIGE